MSQPRYPYFSPEERQRANRTEHVSHAALGGALIELSLAAQIAEVPHTSPTIHLVAGLALALLGIRKMNQAERLNYTKPEPQSRFGFLMQRIFG